MHAPHHINLNFCTLLLMKWFIKESGTITSSNRYRMLSAHFTNNSRQPHSTKQNVSFQHSGDSGEKIPAISPHIWHTNGSLFNFTYWRGRMGNSLLKPCHIWSAHSPPAAPSLACGWHWSLNKLTNWPFTTPSLRCSKAALMITQPDTVTGAAEQSLTPQALLFYPNTYCSLFVALIHNSTPQGTCHPPTM